MSKSKYYSRRYIKSKFDKVKYDIEKVLDVNNEYTDSDSIPEEDVMRVKASIKDSMEAIMNELGIY